MKKIIHQHAAIEDTLLLKKKNEKEKEKGGFLIGKPLRCARS